MTTPFWTQGIMVHETLLAKVGSMVDSRGQDSVILTPIHHYMVPLDWTYQKRGPKRVPKVVIFGVSTLEIMDFMVLDHQIQTSMYRSGPRNRCPRDLVVGRNLQNHWFGHLI